MAIFKKDGDDKHPSYGTGSMSEALKEAQSRGGVERVDRSHEGKGQPVAHVHTGDGSVINILPTLNDPIDEE